MTRHATKGTAILHRHVIGALVAAVFLCLMGSAAAIAADVKEIDVDISPGTTVDTNVGCGFELITEWTLLGVDLYWPIPQPVNNSGLHACNPDNVWVKTSNYQWWCVGVEPFEEFWVVLWGVKGGGGGGGPSKRWMSVSDCDLDADTDNNSVGWPREPDESDEEDGVEYADIPNPPSTVPGIVLGVNDDHDEFLPGADPWGRDLDDDTAELAKEGTNYDGHSVGLAKLQLTVNAERNGQLDFDFSDTIVRLFESDGSAFEGARSLGRGTHELTFWMECLEEDNYSPTVKATFDPVGSPGVAEDAVTVTPVKMDIDVDSDNNGTIVDDNSQAEDLNEAKPGEPGMVVSLTEDPEEPPEGDPNGVLRGLYSMTISDVLDPHDPEVTLKKVSGEGNVQVWKVREGEDPVLMLDTSEDESTTTDGEGGSLWDLLKDCSDHDVIITGIEVGEVQLGLELTVNGAKVAMDVVNVTVLIDLDVDSDNQNGLERSKEEDEIEDDSELPGKYVGVNDDDDDNDGIPDFADGYDIFGTTEGTTGEAFTLMKLELAASVDKDYAKLKFSYDASDPAGVQRTGTPPDYVYTPADGKLRVWTEDGTVFRHKASIAADADGDFVPGDEAEIPASRFTWDSGNVTDLYIEGIHPSAALGDARIVVWVDPDGDGPMGFVADDAVRVTVVQVTLTPYKRDGTTEVTKKIDPGAFVAYNNDDDDADGGGTQMDKDDNDIQKESTPVENDTIKVHCGFSSAFDSMQIGKVVLKRANTKIRLWKNRHKGGADQEIVFDAAGNTEKVYDLSNADQRTAFANDIKGKDLWLEGSEASGALKDTALTLLYRDADSADVCEDPVKVTVVEASLTVYGGDETTAVAIDKESDPGGYVGLNQDDDDEDGTKDRVDDAVATENELLRTTCTFNGFFNALDKGKVVIERTNDKIKVWKQKAKGAGQEIVFGANKKTYDLSDGGQRTAFVNEILGKNLWLEGYAASTNLKDTGIKLEYQDGDDKPVTEDPITMTVLDFQATHVAFNRDRAGHGNDGVNVRTGHAAGTEIEAPEWEGPDGSTKCEPALFVKGKEVSVWVRFTCSPAISSAKSRGEGSRKQAGNLSLGNLGATKDQAVSWLDVTFAAGVSQGVKVPPTTGTDGFVTFVPQNQTADSVLQEDATWHYRVMDINGTSTPWINVCISGQKHPHRLYTILDDPGNPWDTTDTAGDDENQPWTSALEVATANAAYGTTWAYESASPTAAATAITKAIYNCGRFNYDVPLGGTKYGQDPFELTNYLDRIKGVGGNPLVNCLDCAHGTVTLSNLLGCNLNAMILADDIATNEISAIHELAWGTTGWGWHAIGWAGANVDAGKVFDSCLRLDVDNDPVDGTNRTPDIPCDMVFKTTGAGNGAGSTVPAFDPGNTGKGTVTQPTVDDILTRIASWTVTYNGAAKNWTVKETRLGVSTDHTAKATCGAAYVSDGDTNPNRGKVGFTISWPDAKTSTPAPNGQMNGATMTQPTVDNTIAVNETWTVTYKSASNTWGVVGSVSGAKADATPGVAYDNGIVGFTITHGANPPADGANFTFSVSDCWANGDKFTFDTTNNYDDYWSRLLHHGTCDRAGFQLPFFDIE